MVPLPPQARCQFGRSRRKGAVSDRFEDDLQTLGLRHRRVGRSGREVLKLKIELSTGEPTTAISRASEVTAMMVSTAPSTEPRQPINIAAKKTVALPGLEPGCP